MALGDSYAAGLNANKNGRLPICNKSNVGLCGTGANCTSRRCAKNTGAYSYQFYQDNQPEDFTFVACSGANTTTCANLQIPEIPASADLVTINIGGNNGNAFATVVRKCVYLPFQPGCNAALEDAQATIDSINPALNSLFGMIKVAAPNAKVVVLSYVRFWPSVSIPSQCQSKSTKRPSADQKKTMNSLVLRMNQKLAEAANANGFIWVDVDSNFEGHRLCDSGDSYIQWSLKNTPDIGDDIGDGGEDGVDDPQKNPFTLGAFHPNETGHDQYRMELEKAVGC